MRTLLLSVLGLMLLPSLARADLSRDQFSEIYDDMIRSQLEMSQVLLDRVDADLGVLIDSDTPLTDEERAIGGCLYDTMREAGKYDELVAYVEGVASLSEDMMADESVDYVRLMFDQEWQGRMAESVADVDLDMLRSCDALQVARRMDFSEDFWATMEVEARARGLVTDD